MTAVTPSLFSEISTITFDMLSEEFTLGTRLLRTKSETLKYKRFPKAPPG